MNFLPPAFWCLFALLSGPDKYSHYGSFKKAGIDIRFIIRYLSNHCEEGGGEAIVESQQKAYHFHIVLTVVCHSEAHKLGWGEKLNGSIYSNSIQYLWL